MQLDNNGDSEGNFSVLALTHTPHNSTVHKNFTCVYQMRPVGQFYQNSGDIPVSEFTIFMYLIFTRIISQIIKNGSKIFYC